MFIFLIGMPGVGKSYWLKSFAQALQLPGFDLDIYLEKTTGKTIPEIISNGESVFRKMEQQALLSLIKEQNSAVIATGGGTPCYDNNLQQMKKSGIVIHLTRPINQIIKQILQMPNSRPLLKNKSENELREKVLKTFQARKMVYEQADLIFEPNRNEFQTIIQEIQHLRQQKPTKHV